jgi:hypothetical protein
VRLHISIYIVDIIGMEICRLNFVNVLSFIFGAIGGANIGTIERTTGVGGTYSQAQVVEARGASDA